MSFKNKTRTFNWCDLTAVICKLWFAFQKSETEPANKSHLWGKLQLYQQAGIQVVSDMEEKYFICFYVHTELSTGKFQAIK